MLEFWSRRAIKVSTLLLSDVLDLAETATICADRGSVFVVVESGDGPSSSKSAVFPPAALKLFRKTMRFLPSFRFHGTGREAICTFRSSRSLGKVWFIVPYATMRRYNVLLHHREHLDE